MGRVKQDIHTYIWQQFRLVILAHLRCNIGNKGLGLWHVLSAYKSEPVCVRLSLVRLLRILAG